MLKKIQILVKPNCLPCLRAVSVPSRLAMLEHLSHGAMATVGELARVTGLRQPTVSWHVKQLLRTGLVRIVRQGRSAFVELDPRCESCPLVRRSRTSVGK